MFPYFFTLGKIDFILCAGCFILSCMQNKIIFFLLLIIAILFAMGVYVFVGGEPNIKNISNTEIETQDEDVGGISIIALASDTATNTNATNTAEMSANIKNMIYTGVKEPGNTTSVDFVTLEKGGFVVVYENSFEPVDGFLGVSRYLPIGEHTNIFIEFNRTVTDDEMFTLMLHEDNGNGIFNISEDPPVRDELQNSIFTVLRIKSLQ